MLDIYGYALLTHATFIDHKAIFGNLKGESVNCLKNFEGLSSGDRLSLIACYDGANLKHVGRIDMSQAVQYITNEQGERVGVLLDLITYARLAEIPTPDENFLVGLSLDELNALASCKLAVVEQSRLDELITKNTEASLTTEEKTELDDLLAKADHLTILKTRARYTLRWKWSDRYSP